MRDVMVVWELFKKVSADDTWKKIDQVPRPGRLRRQRRQGYGLDLASDQTSRTGQISTLDEACPHTRQPSPEAMKQLADLKLATSDRLIAA